LNIRLRVSIVALLSGIAIGWALYGLLRTMRAFPGVVAAITRRVMRHVANILNAVNPLHVARSGQLPNLG
jgi:hypothetical protein